MIRLNLSLISMRGRDGMKVAVIGELDARSAVDVETFLIHRVQQGDHALVVDLNGVTAIDVEGLQSLLAVQRWAHANNGSLHLLAHPDSAAGQLLDQAHTLSQRHVHPHPTAPQT